MRKKSTGISSKSESEKSSIPYKKADKKRTSPLVAVAKKYFERSVATQQKEKNKKEFPAKGKPTATPYKKKFVKAQDKPEAKAEGYAVAEQEASAEIRLNKYLSHAGIASRRAADELIKEGKVKVNGKVITEMGYKVKPKDKIEFEGGTVRLEKKFYVLLNKPKDYITTIKDDKGRKTVMDLLRGVYEQINSPAKPRLYPVGRLDRNTTGVLLISNDGELAQKLTHPSREIQKVYHVVLDKKLFKEDFDKIAEGGVVLEDGIAEVDEIAYPNPKNKAEVGVQIHTGKNRFIRRLFEALGYEVVKLDRVYFAGLTKKDLPRGRWRFLNDEEVRLLKHFQ